MKRSKWWKYFTRKGPRDAMCNVCLKNIRTSGNTTNLMKHIQIHSESELAEFTDLNETVTKKPKWINMKKLYKTHLISPKKEESKPKRTETGGNFKLKLLLEDDMESGVVSSDPPATDNIPNDAEQEYEEANNDDDDGYQPVEIMYDQMPMETTQPSIAEGGNYNINVNNQLDTVTKCVLYYICMDKCSLDSINNVGFKRLLKQLCPTYKMPEIGILTDYLNSFYKSRRLESINAFKSITYMSMSCHLSNNNYLTIYATYITNKILRSRFLATIKLNEESDSEKISDLLERTCHKFEIDKYLVTCFVASGDPNVKNGVVKFMGISKQLPCFTQMLNHIVESSLKVPGMTAFCQSIRDIMKSLQYSTKHSDSSFDGKTGWLSFYYMLKSCAELSSIPIPTSGTLTNINDIKLLWLLLRPFECALQEKESSSSVTTISKIIPMIITLRNEVDKISIFGSSELLITLKNKLTIQLDKYNVAAEEHSLIAIACILDPRFKQVPFIKVQSSENAIEKIRRMITSSAHILPANSDSYDFWQHYKCLANGTYNDNNDHQRDELTMYLESPVAPLNTDPFLQWRALQKSLPSIYPLAVKYLCIPASAYACDIQALKTKYATNMPTSCLDKILFLRDCTEEEWGL